MPRESRWDSASAWDGTPAVACTVTNACREAIIYAKPTSRVGIIGIGGLGHMAVKFAAAYGCDVTAFTSSESKFEEAKGFGANHVVSSRDSAAIKKLGGSFDLLISTVNVKLDWDAMIGALAPNGRLHVVGAVLEPIPVAAFSLIGQQRSVSGSPAGSPGAMATMLDCAARHKVASQTEHYPMSKINEAFARLDSRTPDITSTKFAKFRAFLTI